MPNLGQSDHPDDQIRLVDDEHAPYAILLHHELDIFDRLIQATTQWLFGHDVTSGELRIVGWVGEPPHHEVSIGDHPHGVSILFTHANAPHSFVPHRLRDLPDGRVRFNPNDELIHDFSCPHDTSPIHRIHDALPWSLPLGASASFDCVHYFNSQDVSSGDGCKGKSLRSRSRRPSDHRWAGVDEMKAVLLD